MDATQLNWLSAADAARAIRDGAVSAEQLVEACLARVRECDAQVQAWAFLDPQHALAQARAADERRKQGAPTGSLHGVPVAIKDIFDTADMPTEDGTALHAGRTPADDATVVARLRAAGAVVVTWAVVAKDRFVVIAGEPARWSSSPGVVRSFCGRCAKRFPAWAAKRRKSMRSQWRSCPRLGWRWTKPALH